VTPKQFRAKRKAAGMTLEQCRVYLRLKTIRAIQFWEAGQRKIPGPVSVLMEKLDSGNNAVINKGENK